MCYQEPPLYGRGRNSRAGTGECDHAFVVAKQNHQASDEWRGLERQVESVGDGFQVKRAFTAERRERPLVYIRVLRLRINHPEEHHAVGFTNGHDELVGH
jgi:hypothetical protein